MTSLHCSSASGCGGGCAVGLAAGSAAGAVADLERHQMWILSVQTLDPCILTVEIIWSRHIERLAHATGRPKESCVATDSASGALP